MTTHPKPNSTLRHAFTPVPPGKLVVLRQVLEHEIERLIELLDLLDVDCDLEPEPDDEPNGDDEPDEDGEPSLGWVGDARLGQFGNCEDLELDGPLAGQVAR